VFILEFITPLPIPKRIKILKTKFIPFLITFFWVLVWSFSCYVFKSLFFWFCHYINMCSSSLYISLVSELG
jgi:hypothetical protein